MNFNHQPLFNVQGLWVNDWWEKSSIAYCSEQSALTVRRGSTLMYCSFRVRRPSVWVSNPNPPEMKIYANVHKLLLLFVETIRQKSALTDQNGFNLFLVCKTCCPLLAEVLERGCLPCLPVVANKQQRTSSGGILSEEWKKYRKELIRIPFLLLCMYTWRYICRFA